MESEKLYSEQESSARVMVVKIGDEAKKIQENVEDVGQLQFEEVEIPEAESLASDVVEGISQKGKLSFEERVQLYTLRFNGLGVREIARRLGRAASTVSREIKRGKKSSLKFWMLSSYDQARCADDYAKKQRCKCKERLRLKNVETREQVKKLIRQHLSPEEVSGRLRLESGMKISHQAIYNYIYEEARELIVYLRRCGKKYRKQGASKSKRQLKQPAAPKTSIDTRPQLVSQRQELGHWEMDTIVSKKSKSCLLVIQEMLSRFFFMIKLPSCTSDSAYLAASEVLQPVARNGWLKSITCDNGAENSCHDRISKHFNIPVYFCHPYSPNERGSVENRNGTIRRFFPKSTDFALITDSQIKHVHKKLVNRPMKCLGYYTPNEIFTDTFDPLLKAA